MRKVCLILLGLGGCQAGAPSPAQLPEHSLPTISGGIQALEVQIQACLHNIANVNTLGYKASRVVLTDVAPTRTGRDGPGVHAALDVGSGVVVSRMVMDMAPGVLLVTGRNLDLALAGRGFFQIQMPSGQTAYTRCGKFCVDGDGRLVTLQGYIVLPETQFPEDVLHIVVQANGAVGVVRASAPKSMTWINTIQLARFMDPESLRNVGNGLFEATETGSGRVIVGSPGDSNSGLGRVLHGYLESSNVNVAEESRRLTRLRRQLGLFDTLFAPELTAGRILPAAFYR